MRYFYSNISAGPSLSWALRSAIALLLLLTSILKTPAYPAYGNVQPLRATAPSATEKVIVDTDIGYDIDDAFALALVLRSPELDVLGVSTASGDTLARAKIVDRMLGESGHADIPVAVGIPTDPPDQSWPAGIIGLQRRYGEGGTYARVAHPQAVDFILGQIRRFPNQVTLVTIGPLSNVGALIDSDIDSFRKVKRVVMMGGWIRQVDDAGGQVSGPGPEYNIMLDIHAAQKLFRSGVPIYMMPIDSTIHLALDEVRRKAVFAEGTPLTDSVALLYLLWGNTTPILYDAMAVAFVGHPELCPVQPVHLIVDDKGLTRVESGTANAQICLHSDSTVFFDYFMRRMTSSQNSAATNFAAKQ